MRRSLGLWMCTLIVGCGSSAGGESSAPVDAATAADLQGGTDALATDVAKDGLGSDTALPPADAQTGADGTGQPDVTGQSDAPTDAAEQPDGPADAALQADESSVADADPAPDQAAGTDAAAEPDGGTPPDESSNADSAAAPDAAADQVAACIPTAPSTETCDGVDNDCDGETDGIATCADGNACTADACNGAAGCSNAPISGGCSDGDACTTGEACSNGACQGATPLVCDDGNVCTEDACAVATGCTNNPAPGTCDDGNACTLADTCNGLSCVGTAKACDDGQPCSTDSCAVATGECQNVAIPGCVTCTADADCADDSLCTTDTCTAGLCVFAAKSDCVDMTVTDVVVTPSVIDTTGGAKQVTITYKQKNLGGKAPATSNWHLPKLSPDPADLSQAQPLVCANSASWGAAAPGTSVALTSTCTIEAGLYYAGKRHIFVVPQNLQDGDASNDVGGPVALQVDYTPKPDLTGGLPLANPLMVKKQEKLASASLIVNNPGDADAGASTTEIWLSWKDKVVGNSQDIKILTVPVPAIAANKSWSTSLNNQLYMDPIMWGWTGTWYLCASQDTTSAVAESNETNNITCVTLVLIK